jgi:hypothetical protein
LTPRGRETRRERILENSMKGLRVAEKQQEIYAKVSPPLNYQKKYY